MSLKRLFLLVPAFLLVTGCVTATQLQQELDPIKQQAASLEERVGTLEGQVSALEDRVTVLENRADTTDAQIDKWEQSLEDISRTSNADDLEMIEEMVRRAEDAANKSERAFMMQQEKGR